jgi:hypothetical protein
MREIRLSGSEGGGDELNRLSLPLSARNADISRLRGLRDFVFFVEARSATVTSEVSVTANVGRRDSRRLTGPRFPSVVLVEQFDRGRAPIGA